MHIRSGEVILRKIRRHPSPYVFKFALILAAAIPVYIVLFLLDPYVISFSIIASSLLLALILGIISIDYWLDHLVISNKRIIWVNWKSLFIREETESELLDIQDINTRETGILSTFSLFDYGVLKIETAASKTTIHFADCPNPERVKHFILEEIEHKRSGEPVRNGIMPSA